ncbi:MAG: DUF4065 domain-containing protein [Desulfobulbaceae bacterium]|nr:DUF4065 domain-containing protein [Desulfobulbaceae bacterium]
MTLKKEQRVIGFRKKNYQVQYHYYFCNDSEQQFTSTELDEINLIQVYNQYRDKHNLPFPEEITETRTAYGLSAAKIAEILGLGTNTYRNYEQGEVPSESNARLIQVAQDPEEFRRIVHLSEALQGKPLEKLLTKIEHLIELRKKTSCVDLEEYFLGSKLPDEYSGYKRPSLEKLSEMVVFFAGQLSPWKTMLNKLLFYADFLHFKKTGYSISGARYCAIPLGPVPNNFNSIFEWINKNCDVTIIPKEFQNGGTGDQFFPAKDRKFKTELFSKEELNTLQTVTSTFVKTTTKEIINISHREKAWIENANEENNMISYLKYGFDLIAV